MEMLPAAAFERLERYGQTLLDAVAGAVADTDAPFVVAGIGSLVSLTPAPGLAPDVAGELSRLFHLAMLLEDIKVGPLLCVSTVTEETDIRRLRSALSNVLPQFAPAGRRATGG